MRASGYPFSHPSTRPASRLATLLALSSRVWKNNLSVLMESENIWGGEQLAGASWCLLEREAERGEAGPAPRSL